MNDNYNYDLEAMKNPVKNATIFNPSSRTKRDDLNFANMNSSTNSTKHAPEIIKLICFALMIFNLTAAYANCTDKKERENMAYNGHSTYSIEDGEGKMYQCDGVIGRAVSDSELRCEKVTIRQIYFPPRCNIYGCRQAERALKLIDAKQQEFYLIKEHREKKADTEKCENGQFYKLKSESYTMDGGKYTLKIIQKMHYTPRESKPPAME